MAFVYIMGALISLSNLRVDLQVLISNFTVQFLPEVVLALRQIS